MTTYRTEEGHLPTAEASSRVQHLLGALTLAEKCAIVAGRDDWTLAGCDRLGIPVLKMSDGPVGVRGVGLGPGLVIPSPSCVAATWDVDLVHELGRTLGDEALDRRVDLLLGPTVNLHRSPRGGRHFEALSEDPELSARIAVAVIAGIQSRGVGACIKHFVANEQEQGRQTVDTVVDEQTLREVYLRPFEAAVTEAGVRSVMAAYNYVNGSHATAQHRLLVEVLKGEWGFDGFVVSDWGATKETVAPALAGLDVEMPGPGWWWARGQLQRAVEDGFVPLSVLDDKVARVLRFLDWRGRLPGTTELVEQPTPKAHHHDLVRRAAAQGAVLVKNDGLLPLRPEGSVALIGHAAGDTALLGGGSAALVPYRSTNLLDALRARFPGRVVHDRGIPLRRRAPSIPLGWVPDGFDVTIHEGSGFDSLPVARERRLASFNAWKGHDLGAVGPVSVRMRFTMVPDVEGPVRLVASAFGVARLLLDGVLVADNRVDTFTSGLGMQAASVEVELEKGRCYDVVLETVPHAQSTGDFTMLDVGVSLGREEDRETRLQEAARVAAQADVAVVVVGSNDEFESEGQDRADLALPLGQDELVRRVVQANPRTVVVVNSGAPMLLPWLEDVAALLLAWYPGQAGGEALADVLLGEVDPGGRMPTTWPRAEEDTPSYGHYPGDGTSVHYREGVLVGHRWYDAHGIAPLIPFGHGLSYTDFAWGAPALTGEGTDVVVEVPVTNVGDRAGSDVVQLYVEPGSPVVPRPVRQLAGFAKLHLAPGESGVARIVPSRRSFARWDTAVGDWVVDPGTYHLVVASSAMAERHRVAHLLR